MSAESAVAAVVGFAQGYFALPTLFASSALATGALRALGYAGLKVTWWIAAVTAFILLGCVHLAIAQVILSAPHVAWETVRLWALCGFGGMCSSVILPTIERALSGTKRVARSGGKGQDIGTRPANLGRLHTLVREIVEESPGVPRRIPVTRVLSAVIRRPSMSMASILGVLVVLGAGLQYASGTRATDQDLTTVLIFAGLGLVSATLPLAFTVRIVRALRSAERGLATITTLEVSQPGSWETLDAIQYGRASGTRLVRTTDTEFQEEFEVEEPWVHQLREGSVLEVLVDPQKRRTVFELGPKS